VDADCGSEATCQSGFCQTGLKLVISSPSGGSVTNGSAPLQVQVDVSGGAPTEVELVVDELPLLKISPPYHHAWDTSSMPDGVHRLWARVVTATRTYESARVEVVLDTRAPDAPVVDVVGLTNASPVLAKGTAEPNATVSVFEGPTQLGQALAAAFTGAWSTPVTLAPGGHAVSATATDAAGNVSAPTSFSIEVDPSQLSIVAQVPPAFPKATRVWSRDPIVVTFSKPVDTSTLTAESVKVSANGVALPLQPFSLSGDGRTLTLALDPAALPPVPSDVVATISSAVTDLAGNALPQTSWTWTIPEWLSPADPLFLNTDGSPAYSSALDPDAKIWVAYNQPAVDQLGLSGTSGGSWVRGDSPDPLSSYSITDFQLGVDSAGRLTVAFVRASQLRVSQLSGGTWSLLGDSLNMAATSAASGVRVAVDSLDRPVVLWAENGQLQAKRWSGTGWSLALGPVAYSSGAYALAIGPGYVPAAAVESTVTGYAGYRVDTSADVSLTFDGDGQPVAAYVTAGAVQVVRPGLPPTSWYTPLGGPLGLDARHPAILHRVAGPTGQQLLLAYEEHASPAGMRVVAWDGSKWNSISTDIGTLSSSFRNRPQLMANRSGVVAVGWTELRYPSAQFVAKLYNR